MARRGPEEVRERDAASATAAEAPYVDPRVTDPRALRYAEHIAERRGAPLKYTVPVAGGPSPRIPRLDQEHIDGATMESQARHGPATSHAPGPIRMPVPNIVEPPVAPRVTPNPVRSPPGLLPTDVLPEEASKDPAFQVGIGCMLAAAQPVLAYRYGVMRGGKRVKPEELGRAGGSPLEAEQRRSAGRFLGLDAMGNLEHARADQAAAAQLDGHIERQVRTGPSGQSEHTASGTKPKLSEQEKKELFDELDDFELDKYRSAVLRDMLNNDEQREIIEKRLRPLSMDALIFEGRVRQVVPIVPQKFEPEFQTYSAEEDLTIKRMITEDAKSLDVSERYFLDKYSLMGLTISLHAVNKTILPDYVNASGDFDADNFWTKYAIVSRFPFHMISSLMVNWFWFEMRVRKLFVAVADDVGNG